MNRYFVYLMFLSMLSNVVSMVPVLLIADRFDGAVLSILLAVPAGGLSVMLFVWLISHFPKQGLPEIMGSFSPWVARPFILLQSALWFFGGSIVLMYISEVVKRFLNPDFTPTESLVLFLTIVILFANLPSEKILYMLEIITVVSVPIILFIMMKAVMNENLMWDSMLEVATYVQQPPTYIAFASSVYMFSGFMAMCIFNRVIAVRPKRQWFLLAFMVLGGLNLFTTFFIPIGFHGADSVAQWTYPWFATADSIRMQFGFIERAFFVFLLLYILVSAVAAILFWHVGLRMAMAVLPKGKGGNPSWFTIAWPYLLLAGLSVLVITYDTQINIGDLRDLSHLWIGISLPNTAVIFAILGLLVARRRRRQSNEYA
jgi:spore germination protein KB